MLLGAERLGPNPSVTAALGWWVWPAAEQHGELFVMSLACLCWRAFKVKPNGLLC